MSKGSREISKELRKKVVEAHQAGKGYKLISKSLGLSKTTIRGILCKWKKFGTVTNLPGRGRRSKISPKMMREIVRQVKKNPHITAKDVQATLTAANISVNCNTIRRVLKVHIRPTLTEHHDIMTFGNSPDEEEVAREAQGKLSDSSDGPRKDEKIEKDSTNDACGEAVKKENGKETLEQHNEDRHDAGHDDAKDASKKNTDDADDANDTNEKDIDGGDDADSDSSIDMIYKYDDDDDEDLS